jgi:hypothetical protein
MLLHSAITPEKKYTQANLFVRDCYVALPRAGAAAELAEMNSVENLDGFVTLNGMQWSRGTTGCTTVTMQPLRRIWRSQLS